MRIKVSHESPISLLERSRLYNDYDYCLVHLMEQHDSYREYFLNARNVYDREVFLDTSVFELGTAFDASKYIDWAEKIRPNLMIIPDVLENAQATMDNWVDFVDKFGDRLDKMDAQWIGVVQGKTLDDIIRCYNFMSNNADVIAISFDMSYFKETGRGLTDYERMCRGRQQLINALIDNDIWDWSKPHHLLGNALPQEMSFYVNNNVYNIRSVDTSNPIVHGLHNVRYNSTFGLRDKIKTKLADLITAKVSDDQWDCIAYNVDMYREILDGNM